MKTALISGSTGLIGSHLLKLLLSSDRYAKVIALTRTPLNLKHDRLVEIVTDFKNLEQLSASILADDIFCCLGTTMAKAGSKKKFREVDFDFPVRLAQVTSKAGASQFLIISALGADAQSSVFYNRVKGEMEDAISQLRFEAIHFFRPSLLLGDRSEKRPGEDLAKAFYKIFWFIIPDKYKAIESAKVSRAMLHYASANHKGVFVHESRDMQRF